MQVTETLNEGLKRGYSIKVEAAELTATVNEKLKEAQPEIEIERFPQRQSANAASEKAVWRASAG